MSPGGYGRPPASRAFQLAAVFALALLAGCGSKSDGGGPAPAPGPITSASVSYTAIGASDAVGIGSSVPCVPFAPCPDGRGYVPSVARELERRGATVTLTNRGVPGAVLAPSIQQLGNQYGRGIPANFEEQQAPFVPRAATLVTILAGGNDTNAVATAIDRGGAGADVDAFIDRQIQDFGASYNRLVDVVRGRASGARIVALNLPNFASLPYTARYTAEQKQWMRRISVGFSRAANALTAKGVVVVDLGGVDTARGPRLTAHGPALGTPHPDSALRIPHSEFRIAVVIQFATPSSARRRPPAAPADSRPAPPPS